MNVYHTSILCFFLQYSRVLIKKNYEDVIRVQRPQFLVGVTAALQ